MRQQPRMRGGMWTHDIVEYDIGNHNRGLDEDTRSDPVADKEERGENRQPFPIEPRLFVVFGF